MPNDTSSKIENIAVNRAKGIEFPTPTVEDNGKVLVYSHESGAYQLGAVGGDGEGDISIADVTLAGDVTGDAESNTVEKVRGKTVAAPEAGDDGQFARYNHGAGTISWESATTSSVTMGGDVTGDSATCTVEKIRNLNVPAPVAGDDEKSLVYEHTGTPAFKYVATYTPGGTDVAVADGGTGASTATAGFDNLAPTTTKGDLVVHDGSDNIRLAVGTDTHVLTADSNEPSGIKWAAAGSGASSKGVDYFRQVGTSPFERYYIAGVTIPGTGLTTASASVGTLRAFPFVTTKGVTLDRIAMRTTVNAATAVARIGIYTATSETDLYPDALLLDSGEISLATAGFHTVTINQALAANTLYWFVHLGGTAAATTVVVRPDNIWPIFGYNNNLDATSAGLGVSVAQAYGALPDPFPASGAVITAAPCPAIAVRFSA